MTNKEIMDIAMQQSAYDTNAKVSDFLQDTNVFVKSGVGPLARKYYKEPIACNFVSYGSNVVASVKDEFKEIVETYLSKFEFYHCFETPNMHWLDERMKEKGYRVCFMAEYFLPDMERLKRLECNYVLKVLEQKDFADLYLPMWGNALCADRKELPFMCKVIRCPSIRQQRRFGKPFRWLYWESSLCPSCFLSFTHAI